MPSPFIKISIAEPCSQNLDKMEPAANGRSCAACQKTVIDFTVMTDEAKKQHLIKTNFEKSCGKFFVAQLDRITINVPSYILEKPIPYWQKYLAVLLICFGTMLFSADVAFGNQLKNSHKTEQSHKKKHPKKKGRIRFVTQKYCDLKDVVSGEFSPEQPQEQHDYFAQKSAFEIFTKNNSHKQASVSENSESPDYMAKNKLPEKKNPVSETLFIVPAVRRMRRRNINRTAL